MDDHDHWGVIILGEWGKNNEQRWEEEEKKVGVAEGGLVEFSRLICI